MNDANFATFDVPDPKTPLDRVAGPTLFQLKEDPASYTPQLPTGKRYHDSPETRPAAVDPTKHLLKAERLLDEALNLAGLMLASFDDECDGRAMQTETALKIIEKKLSKAHTRIDRHRRNYTELCLNYLDLGKRTNEVETS